MLKISYAGCLGLSPAISAQFTPEMRVSAQNHNNSLQPPILEVQGHSRSSMLTFLRICAYLQPFSRWRSQ